MFTPASTLVLEWAFVDIDGKKGQMSMHLPFATTIATLNSFVSIMHPIIATLTGCVIVGMKYRYRFVDNDPGTAEFGSNSGLHFALYYRNEVRYEGFYLPAPRFDFLETSGAYAYTRLDTSLSEVQSALSDLATALEAVVTPEGDPYPTEFLAGGLMI